MSAIQTQHGPFAWQPPKEWGVNTGVLVVHEASQRLNMVRESTDPDWLRAVAADRDVQLSVRTAAQRLLRIITR